MPSAAGLAVVEHMAQFAAAARRDQVHDLKLVAAHAVGVLAAVSRTVPAKDRRDRERLFGRDRVSATVLPARGLVTVSDGGVPGYSLHMAVTLAIGHQGVDLGHRHLHGAAVDYIDCHPASFQQRHANQRRARGLRNQHIFCRPCQTTVAK
jgi:hypothetical protein